MAVNGSFNAITGDYANGGTQGTYIVPFEAFWLVFDFQILKQVLLRGMVFQTDFIGAQIDTGQDTLT